MCRYRHILCVHEARLPGVYGGITPLAFRPDVQRKQLKVKICLTTEFFKKKRLLDEVTLNQSKESVSQPLFSEKKLTFPINLVKIRPYYGISRA